MKTLNLMRIFGVILLGVFGGASCALQKVSDSGVLPVEPQLKVKTDKTSYPAKITNNLEGEPSLFHFASNSDYVVTATVTAKKTISKRVQKQNPGELPDISDSAAAILYTFQVEKQLCSKQLFSFASSQEKDLITNFEIFVPMQEFSRERYTEGKRYLIFLNKLPDQNKIAEVYEIDKNKSYYRAFDGKTIYLLPTKYDAHRISTKGILDLSEVSNQETGQRIETFCSALDEPDKLLRLSNLQKLADSTDEELKTNASYAIRTLQ